MRLSNEDIAMRLASLIDLALDDLAQMPAAGARVERVNALLNVARDGLERLAHDMPKGSAAVDAAAVGGNVVPFPARRVASA